MSKNKEWLSELERIVGDPRINRPVTADVFKIIARQIGNDVANWLFSCRRSVPELIDEVRKLRKENEYLRNEQCEGSTYCISVKLARKNELKITQQLDHASATQMKCNHRFFKGGSDSSGRCQCIKCGKSFESKNAGYVDQVDSRAFFEGLDGDLPGK